MSEEEANKNKTACETACSPVFPANFVTPDLERIGGGDIINSRLASAHSCVLLLGVKLLGREGQ